MAQEIEQITEKLKKLEQEMQKFEPSKMKSIIS
jgi:hypothetical protein